ncbi:MAG: DUF4129 domain-containing protein [Anaerolineae bacterium]|nr:DUF4129 domain-containing protein [Anaerolineae bacterium]
MPGRGWRSYNWLDSVAIPVLSAAMRVAWVVPVSNALMGSGFVAPSARLSAWLPLAVLLGASFTARRLAARPGGRVLMALAGVLVMLGSAALVLAPASPGDLWRHAMDWHEAVPAIWVLLPVFGGLWLRGISIDWIEAEPLRRGFVTGVLALAALALLGGYGYSLGLGISDSLLEPFVAFTVSGLVALALSDISLTLRQSARSSGTRPGLGRYWLYVVGGSVLAVLLAAWLVALIVAPETVEAAAQALRPLLRLFQPVVNLLARVLAYLITGIAYIVFTILEPLINWLRSLASGEPPDENILDRANLAEQLRELEPGGQGGAELGPWVQGVLVVGLLGLVALVFVLAFRRRYATSPDGMVESREVDWSWHLMREQLGRWLSRRRRQTRSRFLPLLENEQGRVQVRTAYRRLLASAGGHAPGQTPLAYMRQLAGSGPELEEPLAALTEAYQMARYSSEPLTPETVAAALQSLAQVEALLGARHPGAPEPEGDGNGG